jgi:hypothetical protein
VTAKGSFIPSLWLLVVTAFGVAGCVSSCHEQPPQLVTLAPVGMDPKGPYIADRTGALAFWGNGSLQSRVYLDKGPVAITLRARGLTVDGQAPRLRIVVGAHDLGSIDVDSRVLKDYTVNTTVDRGGTTTVKVSFDNYLPKPRPIESRHVFIESVALQQPG